MIWYRQPLTILWILFVLGTVVLAGCATSWIRDGVTELQGKRDTYECRRDSAGIPHGPRMPQVGHTFDPWISMQNSGQSMSENAIRGRLYEMCMEAKGYERQSR